MDQARGPKGIVTSQELAPGKLDLARRLRREMSPVERVLWRRLRANQVGGYHFRRQQIVSGFVADFYCQSAGLAVEVDGETHTDPEYDAMRDRVFAEKGIRVLRFANAQMLHEMDAVLAVILEAVEKGRETSP